MEERRDLEPRKIGKIMLLMKDSPLKQEEFAGKLFVPKPNPVVIKISMAEDFLYACSSICEDSYILLSNRLSVE